MRTARQAQGTLVVVAAVMGACAKSTTQTMKNGDRDAALVIGHRP
jgi:hypothetical protein